MANIDYLFKSLHFYPKYPDRLVIEWDVYNKSLIADYFFDVYLSSHPEQDYKKITAVPVVNNYRFETNGLTLYKGEKLYCKVEATINNEKYMSKPQDFFYNLPENEFLIAREIMRKNDLIRKVKIGVKVQVFKRRTFGPKCTKCIHPSTGYTTDSRCTICYGTKIVGGYFPPVENYAEIVETVPREHIPTELGTTDNIVAMAKMSYPIVNKNDVIMEKKRNRRWFVNPNQIKFFRTVPIDQTIVIRQISPKDIEYTLFEEFLNE